MNEETSYNLAINELKKQKLILDKEISSLIIDRDKIKNEIASQRSAKTEIYHEQKSLETLRYFLDEQTKLLTEIRSKNYQNFTVEYDKHNLILQEIWNSIEQSKKLLSDFETSKEDIKKVKIQKEPTA